jgi:GNAT superfamily N-acetyltransferase
MHTPAERPDWTFTLATNASTPSVRLIELIEQLPDHRGGAALLETLLDGKSASEALLDAVDNQELWLLHVSTELAGYAILRNDVLQAIFVEPTFRLQGLAASFIATLRRDGVSIIDGLALPGDRATKSLYESIGWKARLLTMRSAS